MEAKKGRLKMPHIYIILVTMMLLMAILTYIIPTGEFERVESSLDGRTVIDPETFSKIESVPIGIKSLMTSIPQGFVQSADIIMFVFAAGGAFTVLLKTGIIEIGVNNLSRRFSNKPTLLVIVLMIAFGLLSTFAGLPELSLVYLPIILPLIIKMGYDSVTAVAITLVSTSAGFTSSITNPLVGISQTIAEVPIFSGAGFRFIVFIVLLSLGIFFVLKYANKVRENPESSLTYLDDAEKRNEAIDTFKSPLMANKRQKFASVVALLFLIMLVLGVLKDGWYMLEIAGFFIVLSIIVGLIAGLNISDICDYFTDGCKTVFLGAFIIGISRSIVVIMEQGKIIDSIIYGLSIAVDSLPGSITIIGMFIGNTLLNFLIPSGSGQALVTIPIMAPLADILGITRQSTVIAFHLGDGLSNIFYPTVGYFMATLAIAGVSWTKWIRFFIPLGIAWVIASSIILLVAQAINLGPY